MQDEAKLSYVQFYYCNSLNINLSLLITLHHVLNHTSKPQKCSLEGPFNPIDTWGGAAPFYHTVS